MSEIAQTYRIILDAEMTTQSRQAFQETIQHLEEAGFAAQRVSITEKDLGAETEMNLNKMARSALHVTRLWSVMEMAFMRQEVALNILESAQDRYNRAVLDYGENSYQAVQAGRQLERIQNYIERTNIRAGISVITYVTQLAIESGLLSTLSTKLGIYTAAKAAATVAEAGHATALGATATALGAIAGFLAPYKIPLMIGGALAVGAVAGYALTGGFTPRTPTNINLETNLTAGAGVTGAEIDRALEEHNEWVKESVRRIGP